jgi:curved DNA-binding protein CbpA
LGVSETATEKAIKQAFYARAKQLHPDKSGPENAKANKELFVEVTTAYETLSDADAKAAYDEQRKPKPSFRAAHAPRRHGQSLRRAASAAMQRQQHRVVFDNKHAAAAFKADELRRKKLLNSWISDKFTEVVTPFKETENPKEENREHEEQYLRWKRMGGDRDRLRSSHERKTASVRQDDSHKHARAMNKSTDRFTGNGMYVWDEADRFTKDNVTSHRKGRATWGGGNQGRYARPRRRKSKRR